MKMSLIALIIGFMLDLIFGDPGGSVHPVVLIGKLIGFLEKWMRRLFPKTPTGERLAGGAVWILVVLTAWAVPAALLAVSYGLNPYLGLGVESILCGWVLATKSLRDESMKVYHALYARDTEQARYWVSRIVGRDTACLDEAGITRAAVETVAENTSDGVIAPLFYLALGGPALGMFYKAVNTMDSMLGYVDPPYTHIGLVSAKMDDVFNFLPARLSALLMLLGGAVLGMDVKNGWKIFRRDRYNHASPNSAQTESVCAGLLGVRLAGDAWYHGCLHKKPYIGDPCREIEAADIVRTCRLLYVTAAVSLIAAAAWKLLL